MENLKRAVIWGAGRLGTSKLLCELLGLRYEIMAYCDSNQAKWGTTVNGYEVKSIDETAGMNRAGVFDVIVIAVYDVERIRAIRKVIEEWILPAGPVEVYAYGEIGGELEAVYLSRIHTALDFAEYRIDYRGQFRIWLDNILTEVDYWVNSVAKEKARFREDYCGRLCNTAFVSEFSGDVNFLSNYLCGMDHPVVYDIGCGLVPRFGEVLPNGRRITMTRIDPLAYFYNVVNEKYAPDGAYKKVVFGMFEYFSRYFAKDSADAVLINNALDHCIDPYKSIVESLAVLKPGGILYLNHTRAEGVNEKYYGLHQWNLDYTGKGDFIIWNYGAAVNVSERLGEIADIKLTHIETDVRVEMVKKRDFETGRYVDTADEMENMAFIIGELMRKLSDPAHNLAFGNMLMDDMEECR